MPTHISLLAVLTLCVATASGDSAAQQDPAQLWLAGDNATLYLGSTRQAAVRLRSEGVAIDAARVITSEVAASEFASSADLSVGAKLG